MRKSGLRLNKWLGIAFHRLATVMVINTVDREEREMENMEKDNRLQKTTTRGERKRMGIEADQGVTKDNDEGREKDNKR